MPVSSTCVANANAVELDLRHERLRYRAGGEAGVIWVLNDENDTAILSDAGPFETVWPADRLPATDDVTHALGMQFGQGGTVDWTVERVTLTGQLLDVLKQCRYEHSGDPDEHFAALRIFITGRPA